MQQQFSARWWLYPLQRSTMTGRADEQKVRGPWVQSQASFLRVQSERHVIFLTPHFKWWLHKKSYERYFGSACLGWISSGAEELHRRRGAVKNVSDQNRCTGAHFSGVYLYRYRATKNPVPKREGENRRAQQADGQSLLGHPGGKGHRRWDFDRVGENL